MESPLPASSKCSTMYYPLSPVQLREMWDFDNKCATQLSAPLRTCSSVESDNSGGVTEEELKNFKRAVANMWEKAKHQFEIVFEQEKPELGFRLRVKKSVPKRVKYSLTDGYVFGWFALLPPIQPTSPGQSINPCAHLYWRSPAFDKSSNQKFYIGGPASYMQWKPNKESSVTIERHVTGNIQHLGILVIKCKGEKNADGLSGGDDLTWSFGFDSVQTTQVPWSQDKCCIIYNQVEERYARKRSFTQFTFWDKCVLCGEVFSMNNKDRRVQRKPHFICSHADYFGREEKTSDMLEEINGLKVLTEADKLNYLISNLLKLNWNVVPACTLISSGELDASACNKEELLQQLKDKCTFLRETGTLVLRGFDVIDRRTILDLQHFKPIKTSVWRTLNWSKQNGKPCMGNYGLPSHLRDVHEKELQLFFHQFCLLHLS